MKKIIVFLTLLIAAPVFSAPFKAVVEKTGYNEFNQVLDQQTGAPVGKAKISIPSKRYTTTTDTNGKFDINTKIDSQSIMSVQKNGYKPYSLTIDQNLLSKPLSISIEKSTPNDVILETELMHLGDNSFSENSANAEDFKAKAVGPFYSKNFNIKSPKTQEDAYLVIGSLIGVDTLMAKNLGQSKVRTAYSSPAQVYFNGQKIAELQLNGDNQKIKLPKGLINENQSNEITIRTGKNLFQTAYIDYDDIELMNLFIEFK